MGKQKGHKGRAHALLGASKASRWMNCPPSARMEDELPDEGSSVFAEEGTLAHEMGELSIKHVLNLEPDEKCRAELKKLTEHKLYSKEMIEPVQDYRDHVKTSFLKAGEVTPDALLILEKKVDLTAWVPEGFGSCDSIIIYDGRMIVTDLKFGKGIQVSAENNEQLMLYALGALEEYDMMYGIEIIRMEIFQPRLHNYSTFEMSADDLYAWAEEHVKPRAAQAWEGEGECKVGGWCRFCKASAVCAAQKAHADKIVCEDFATPNTLDPDQLAEIYKEAGEIEKWLAAVKKHVLIQSLNGEKFKGLKVVAGRANRKWLDKEAAIAELVKLGKTEDDYLKKDLRGIGDIEKLVGKASFPKVMKNCVGKPPGSPTVVPESDARPPLDVSTPEEDFK